MNAHVEKCLTIQSTACDFAPHRSWMRLNEGQLRRSMECFLEEIRLTVMHERKLRTLKLMSSLVLYENFQGTMQLLWTYRCNSIGPGDRLPVQFRVCETGKPANIVVSGILTYDPL